MKPINKYAALRAIIETRKPQTAADSDLKDYEVVIIELYDEVVQLEAELGKRPPKLPEHEVADSAQWWHEKYKELEAENKRLKNELDHEESLDHQQTTSDARHAGCQ